MTGFSGAAAIWKERMDRLQEALAVEDDPTRKLRYEQQIKECQEKIKELTENRPEAERERGEARTGATTEQTLMRLRADLAAHQDLYPIVEFIFSNDSEMGQIALDANYKWEDLRRVLRQAEELRVSADKLQRVDAKEDLARIEWVQASIWVYFLLIYAAEKSVLRLKSKQHEFALSVFHAIVDSRGFPMNALSRRHQSKLHKTALLISPKLSTDDAPKKFYQRVRALAIDLERELMG